MATPIPRRVDLKSLGALIRQQREAGYSTILLSVDDVDSMATECELYRTRYDASTRRQKDAARARKSLPKITLENVDRNDADPDGS